MSRWTVLRDPFPLAPSDDDAIGQIVAPDRESARRQAARLFGAHVLVVAARSWPAKAAREGTP